MNDFDRTLAKEATRAINRAINDEDARLRARYSFLRHQDFIGASLWLLSLFIAIGVAALYIRGVIPAWSAIICIALPLSILHELEHDLIHGLYFSERPGVQHLMFASI